MACGTDTTLWHLFIPFIHWLTGCLLRVIVSLFFDRKRVSVTVIGMNTSKSLAREAHMNTDQEDIILTVIVQHQRRRENDMRSRCVSWYTRRRIRRIRRGIRRGKRLVKWLLSNFFSLVLKELTSYFCWKWNVLGGRRAGSGVKTFILEYHDTNTWEKCPEGRGGKRERLSWFWTQELLGTTQEETFFFDRIRR